MLVAGPKKRPWKQKRSALSYAYKHFDFFGAWDDNRTSAETSPKGFKPDTGGITEILESQRFQANTGELTETKSNFSD
jgi:hypothetical protein